ncbi:hypothetical protein L198_07583 [Cryptococcus wingfieldii CBS 7118]|uniref:Uncharacterized protein n=1 Tax=Cryptococcus wingfieldii CBS 7118 TaxID=1295528 RepID=A0A1E3I9D7_9TREE|nr:hypothetical protein L198_07583 [Cryptococcus wingfieldii CBS 7118]ODN85259.1 hypothetical protein L198_07583 [Cryptococcus wingfieldii CBS 7118]
MPAESGLERAFLDFRDRWESGDYEVDYKHRISLAGLDFSLGHLRILLLQRGSPKQWEQVSLDSLAGYTNLAQWFHANYEVEDPRFGSAADTKNGKTDLKSRGRTSRSSLSATALRWPNALPSFLFPHDASPPETMGHSFLKSRIVAYIYRALHHGASTVEPGALDSDSRNGTRSTAHSASIRDISFFTDGYCASLLWFCLSGDAALPAADDETMNRRK